MKKFDYYAVPQPWRMPKWVGVMLGGVFAVIAIGSVVIIVQLTRTVAPPVTAVAAAAAVAPASAAPAVAPAAATAPAAKAAPVASADSAPAPATHAKHHASHHHKAVRLASARHSSIETQAQRNTILAKHDTKEKRHEKDALDKLLGL